MSAGSPRVRLQAPRLRLGTRGSTLALIQSRQVASALEAAAGASVSLHTIRTRGDEQADASLARIGGEGVFTSALDGALLDGAVDVAVHSLKDLPTRMTPGLCVAATPPRADPRDALVLPPGDQRTLATLPAGSRIGTGSQRRAALARAFRPDCMVVPMRGNVDTRLAKLDRGHCEALVLAAAGLGRMGLSDRASELLERTAWLPAAGQGALAVVVRCDDPRARRLAGSLDDGPTRQAVRAERELLRLLGAGCHLPVGVLGLPYPGGLRLWAMVLSPDGRRIIRFDRTGRQSEPERLAADVAAVLLGRGAGEILADLSRAPAQPPP
ncbi:MAG: hydroxymethylbilane synthase [Gammaproteobacteria bacterium]|nr:hydroxymethylbilane synthase [Gammaproteobacteria bacterium]